MNGQHQLDCMRPGFRWSECEKIDIPGISNYGMFAAALGIHYEIQRAEVTMDDGYKLMVNSDTKVIISYSDRYIKVAGSRGKQHTGVYRFEQYTFRRDHVANISVWVTRTESVRINRVPFGSHLSPEQQAILSECNYPSKEF